MRFSDCFETDVALARWDAQREWRKWRTILRRLEARGAARQTRETVTLWLANAKAKCRRLREEMRA
jgi:hypothetical protein